MSAINPEVNSERAERYTWDGMNFDDFEIVEGDGEVLTLEGEEDEEPREAQDENPDIERRIKLPYGLTVYIENEAGSLRRGPWGQVIMQNPYGYIGGTEGVDGDAVDCFLGRDYETASLVYVIHQGAPDPEDKLMIGFNSAREAQEAYRANYNEAPDNWSMSKIALSDLPAKLNKLRGRRIK